MNAKKNTQQWGMALRLVLFVLGLLFLATPRLANAQLCVAATEGFNAVYGNCNNGVTVVPSPAFVDAAACAGERLQR